MKFVRNKIKPFIYIVFFTVSYCFSQSPNNFTISTKNKIKKIDPGKHYTVLFDVANNTNENTKLIFEYNFPSVFKPILTSKTKTVSANGKKKLLLSFSVTRFSKAKNYEIEVLVKKNNAVVAVYKLNFEVSKIYNIEISPTKSPDYLRLEKEFTCEYVITNKGNSEEKIDFESISSISVNPMSVILKPDSIAVVKVKQAVPFSPFNKSLAVNILKANIVSSGESFSNRVPITVYPNSTKKPDYYFRYPINISTVYNYLKGTEDVKALKINVNGAGFLDRGKEHYLKVYYSGPNQPDLTRFGEYEEYNILYRSKKFEINAGDVSYTLSNITESSRNGKGAITKYNFNKSRVSLFYLEPRFTDNISTSFGGSFEWNPNEKYLFKLGVIGREIVEDDVDLNSQIFSVSTAYGGKYLKLKGEIAFETNELTNGFAGAAEAYYSKGKFQWGNSAQYSDENYKGYLRNSKLFYSNIGYQLSKKLNVQLNANYTSINPEQDDINYSSSPITTSYGGSFNYRINAKNKIRFGASYRKKEDRLEPQSFNFEEELINLSYTNQKMNSYSLQLTNRYGSSTNFLLDNPSPTTSFYSTAELSVYILKYFSVGVFGNYEYTGRNSVDNEIDSSIYYGATLECSLRNKLNLNFYYRNDYAIDELESDAQSYLQAQLQYNINSNHRFSFSAAQTSLPSDSYDESKELLLSAGYRLTINTPLSKDKTKGTLKGKVSSKENDNLEGILISLNNKASVTNKKGEFEFYNLVPNEYTLMVAQSSLPKNKIIVEKTPLVIDIAPNKESFINLNLGKTGRVKGVIELKKLSYVSSTEFEKKLPRVVVKISNGDKKYLTQTNNKGEFSFVKLVPGEWTVEILVKSLAKDFTFKPTKRVIEILPDEEVFVKFNAMLKNRTLKKSKKKFKL